MNPVNILSPAATHPRGLFLGNLAKRLEHFRIKNHLRMTEEQLRNKDTSHLSPLLQKKREENLDRLHEYWKAGVFPKNLDFPGKRISYFIDAKGTPCAMAYLIAESGHEALTKRVQKTNNHIYINDIKSGPVLDWIKKSGLTQKEASKIQPGYYRCMNNCSFFAEHLAHIIIPIIFFIAAEWLSYFISKKLLPTDNKKRSFLIAYLTPFNILAALIISVWIYNLIG